MANHTSSKSYGKFSAADWNDTYKAKVLLCGDIAEKFNLARQFGQTSRTPYEHLASGSIRLNNNRFEVSIEHIMSSIPTTDEQNNTALCLLAENPGCSIWDMTGKFLYDGYGEGSLTRMLVAQNNKGNKIGYITLDGTLIPAERVQLPNGKGPDTIAKIYNPAMRFSNPSESLTNRSYL